MSKLDKLLGFLVAPLTGGASLIGTAFGMLSDSFEAKRQEKKSKREHEQKLRENRQAFSEKRALSGDESAAELDRVSIQNRGWKDDWLLFLTTMPMAVMFFEPLLVLIFGMQPYKVGAATTAIDNSFSALAKAPEYYWWALALIYIDTFGFRRMLRVALENFIKLKVKQWFGKSSIQ